MTRRGVALLLVLLVLVVATTAAAGAARLAIASRAHAVVAQRSRVADALRIGAEGHIDHFLRTRSSRVVLAPDSGAPCLLILDDRLLLGDCSYQIIITAYDQCGMLPWPQTRRGSPLRAGLPAKVARFCDAPLSEGPVLGLDTLVRSARSTGLRSFPPSPDSTHPSMSATTLAIGALIATHNPEPPSRSGALAHGGLINVNTAPRPLLAVALRAAGASALDEILASRAAGHLASAPATSAPSSSSSELSPSVVPIRLVAQSDCWAFRLDVQTTSVRRSWWLVYRATGSEWRCVQRVAINE